MRPIAALLMATVFLFTVVTGAIQEPSVTVQSAGTDVRLIGLDAVSRDTVWAAGGAGTVVRSLDGGVNWTIRVVAGAEALEFRDIAAFDGQTAVVLSAGTGNASRIYRTDDAGLSWQLVFQNELPEAFFDCLAFWDASQGLAFSDSTQGRFPIISTTDGGRSWESLPAPPDPLTGEGSFAASGTCVATGDAGRAWIGTGAAEHARVLSTADFGRSWRAVETPIVSGASAGIASVVIGQNALYALGGNVANTSEVGVHLAVSTDGGLQWAARAVGQLPAIYGATIVHHQSREVLLATGPGGLFASSDQGVTWRRLSDDNLWSVAGVPSRAWAVGPAGRIVRIDYR